MCFYKYYGDDFEPLVYLHFKCHSVSQTFLPLALILNEISKTFQSLDNEFIKMLEIQVLYSSKYYNLSDLSWCHHLHLLIFLFVF